MLRKWFSYGGTLLLAGAAVFAMPGPARAQHGGGGHGGGGHFGGANFGGGHFGGAHYGGYHGGFYHGGSGYGYPHAYYPNYGYHRYYPHYYNYYPYPYDTYPYDGSGSTYNSGYYSPYGEEPSDTVAPETAPAPPDNTAHVTVSVPADAEVWFDGTETTTTGSTREFQSPPLTPGSRYTYEVRARWNENGHEVTQTQQVAVTAGAHVHVDFPVPPKTAGQGSAVKKG